jgi:N-acetylmuramoyl-L-alanine amidase
MPKALCAIGAVVLVVLGVSCARIEERVPGMSTEEVWRRLPPVKYEIPPYAQYLKGIRVCLDPGHGGDAHLVGYKRGPTGLREAVINLRVAQYLREFLEAAGAEVFLTREGDYDTDPNASVALRKRAEMASEKNCDFFISIHHNASSRQTANFTSVWYHESPDYVYANMDLARYVSDALEELLHLPEVHNDGLYSDYLMYPDAGFGVLRHLRVPGILVEISFFSDPQEEKRLADPEYNRRAAWGLFLGIARYVRNGIPTAELLAPTEGAAYSPTPLIMFRLKDGIPVGWGAKGVPRIFENSIVLMLDDQVVPHTYDPKTAIVSYQPTEPLAKGEHRVLIRFENASKNHNLAKPFTFQVP